MSTACDFADAMQVKTVCPALHLRERFIAVVTG